MPAISAEILALVEIYGPDKVSRASSMPRTPGLHCEYIANLLEQRARRCPSGVLHLTGSTCSNWTCPPDLSVYDLTTAPTKDRP